jgi:hypothetical protein
MKNIVSFETALKLKAAGFPQPKSPSVGDFFYYAKKPVVISAVGEGYEFVDLVNAGGYSCDENDFKDTSDDFVFAPTATDILGQPEMEGFVLMKNKKGWGCFHLLTSLNSSEAAKVFEHENPAEAAALAFKAQKK